MKLAIVKTLYVASLLAVFCTPLLVVGAQMEVTPLVRFVVGEVMLMGVLGALGFGFYGKELEAAQKQQSLVLAPLVAESGNR